jgi:hypothetical protein
MKISVYLIGLALGLTGFLATACGSKLETGNDLSGTDKAFIRSLGLLDSGEHIILFDSQGGGFNGLKTSGNFFTDKRIASYWIDRRDSSQTNVESAFYTDVDTIWRYPKFRSLTLASYLEVHRRDGTKFKVYVSADSVGTWNFFNKALEEWSTKNAR